MYKLILFLFIVFNFSNLGYCETFSKYEFVKDYIVELRYLKEVSDRDKLFSGQKFSSDISTQIASMKVNELAIMDIETARNFIKKYQQMPNLNIKDIVTYNLKYLDSLEDIRQQSNNAMERLNSPDVLNHPENFNLGKEMKKIAELSAIQDETMGLIFHDNIMIALTLLSSKPDANGKMSILDFTSQQRQDLIDSLVFVFGNEIKRGLVKGISYVDGCGAGLYIMLSSKNTLDGGKPLIY